MSLLQSSQLKIATAWAAILLSGAGIGWWNAGRHVRELTGQVVRGTTRAAIGFDAAEVRQLGAAGDAAHRGAVEARLRKFKAVDPRIRSIYLLRIDEATPQGVPLAHSGAAPVAAAETAARPGAAAAGLAHVLLTGEPTVEGPLSDGTSDWMRGWALIDDATNAPPRHVLGLDIDAEGWRTETWRAGFEGAFYWWILFGLPFAAWLVMRRQHEQREVIRNLSEAMEQSHSAIMIVDLEGRIEYANRGVCRQIGYGRRELIGREWGEFQTAAVGAGATGEMLATARAGRPWEGEWFSRRKDGTTYPVRGVVTPVKHRDGSLACFVAVYDDVTETKAREEELRDARDAALAGDRAKGQFLATMSHEVRTPLNGIVGFTSLLLETPLSSEQREYVQTIRMSTEALIQLTGDILDFARIESGKLKLDPLACDPRECIEDALDLLAAKAAEKNLELLHRVAPDVPAAIIADGGRLRQVLVNLVGNAVKFTERGEVEVSVAVGAAAGPPAGRPSAERAGHGPPDAAAAECTLVFSVRDTGIGIAAEHHAKLFRPFTQVDDTTTRRYGGTGLGLAICRNLVELMAGRIYVESQPGHGSTFSFSVRVPVAAPQQPNHDLAGLRFALAIGSEPLRRELAALAASWNAEVVTAANAAELAGGSWDVALVEVTETAARDLAGKGSPADWPPDKCLGLVPISLPNDLRASLRAHFRLLVNKPVHHDTLFGLLSGARVNAPTGAPPTQFGFRVLAVDDNATNRRLIKHVLGSFGCTVRLLEDGRQAIHELTANAGDFDVVLLDLHMPEMDGIAALREIRSGQAGSRAQTMWIIALTADAREQQRARAMESGVNDYLTKPLKLQELETAFRRLRSERMARKR